MEGRGGRERRRGGEEERRREGGGREDVWFCTSLDVEEKVC